MPIAVTGSHGQQGQWCRRVGIQWLELVRRAVVGDLDQVDRVHAVHQLTLRTSGKISQQERAKVRTPAQCETRIVSR